MIWAFMLGAAATVRTRQGIVITLVADYVSPGARVDRRYLRRFVQSFPGGIQLAVFRPALALRGRLRDTRVHPSQLQLHLQGTNVHAGDSEVVGVARHAAHALMSVHALANWLDSLEALVSD